MPTDQVGADQSELLRRLTKYFLVAGVAGVIFGLIHGLALLTGEYTTTRLADALINTLFGVMAFICWRLLVSRRRIVVAVWVGAVVVALIYALAMGRGFNVVVAVAGAVVLGLFITLSRRGELV